MSFELKCGMTIYNGWCNAVFSKYYIYEIYQPVFNEFITKYQRMGKKKEKSYFILCLSILNFNREVLETEIMIESSYVC